MPGLICRVLDVIKLPKSRIRQRGNIDWCIGADRRDRPGCLQELPAGALQIRRPGAHLLGIADQHGSALGQMVHQYGQLTRMQDGQ